MCCFGYCKRREPPSPGNGADDGVCVGPSTPFACPTEQRRLTPSRAGPELHALAPKCRSHGRMGDAVTRTEPRKGSAGGIELGSFRESVFCQALAPDSDILLAKDERDAGLRDAVVGADLFGGFAGIVPTHDVIDVRGDQKALRTRESATGRWSPS